MYKSVMEQPLIISGSLNLPVGWSAPLHRHPHSELLLVRNGSMQVEIDGHGQAAAAGDLILYPPGSQHRERNAGRRALELCYVHGRLGPVAGNRLADRQGRLAQVVRWLVEDQAAGASPETLAGWMEVLRVQTAGCGDADGGLARTVRADLRSRTALQHTVPGLARAAGLGPRQFLRRYRAETGSTPMADLRRMRCEAAADLLVSTDWPLERIAGAVGFCDAFHLSKVFRDCYGTPPGRMRSAATSRSRGRSPAPPAG